MYRRALCDVIMHHSDPFIPRDRSKVLSARDEGSLRSHSCHPSERYVDGLLEEHGLRVRTIV